MREKAGGASPPRHGKGRHPLFDPHPIPIGDYENNGYSGNRSPSPDAGEVDREQDGGDPWIHLRTRTYDNRDLRLVEEEYHTSVTGSHRIARRENAGDAIGKRYQRVVYKVNKTTGDDDPRHFFFDNQWRPIEERVDDAVKTHFAWSPFDRWSLIRRKRTVTTPLDETLFLLKDSLDPAAIINTSGVVQERFAFDTFGPHRFLDQDFDPVADSFAWNFLFHAEFMDPESGLYNYGFRYYHPDLGRWLSRDPVGERTDPNLYEFVDNAAFRHIDNLGMQKMDGILEFDPFISELFTTERADCTFSRYNGYACEYICYVELILYSRDWATPVFTPAGVVGPAAGAATELLPGKPPFTDEIVERVFDSLENNVSPTSPIRLRPQPVSSWRQRKVLQQSIRWEHLPPLSPDGRSSGHPSRRDFLCPSPSPICPPGYVRFTPELPQ